jgi:hypothetical protein
MKHELTRWRPERDLVNTSSSVKENGRSPEHHQLATGPGAAGGGVGPPSPPCLPSKLPGRDQDEPSANRKLDIQHSQVGFRT